MQIRPGDMYLVAVPFRDDVFTSKLRPVVVLRDEGNGLTLIAPVTGTNLTGQTSGLWITKESDEGKQMNLTKDSFIATGKALRFPTFGFVEYWGHCPIVDELLKKMEPRS